MLRITQKFIKERCYVSRIHCLRPLEPDLYSSPFKLQRCWLPLLTPVTYSCKLLGLRSVAAYLQLE
ncbi:hypothetical protein C9426_06360 [Serratia sp. S1B]|nr:hypothetical protein C9426_06360 [Serratia sp. S1B]